MGRRRRQGTNFHGWLNINKPVGMTSATCVAVVRKTIDAAKVGHAGTLDPLASGVLPIALGEATKTVAYMQDFEKIYDFSIRWGERRATDDTEGEVIATSDHRPSETEIRAALPDFVGLIEQTPPAFSAIKVNGERAYALAREGIDPDLKSRHVTINKLDLTGISSPDAAEFTVMCGKGMYVRSLARDLAIQLGTEGHLGHLVRRAVGPFVLDEAISLELLQELSHIAPPFEAILPIQTALADIPALALSVEEALRLRNGQPVPIMRPADRDLLNDAGEDAPLLAMNGDQVVALVRSAGIQVHPLRVFNI